MLKNWGVKEFAEHEHGESVDEMKHADEVIKRILFLEDLPNLQELNKLYIGEDMKDILECDLRLEMEAIPVLGTAIVECENQRDFVIRDLLTDILDEEEGHVDWIEAQLGLIEKMGSENYIQHQS